MSDTAQRPDGAHPSPPDAAAAPEERAGLLQIVYASVAATDLAADEVRSVIDASRRRNAARRVTGMLLYQGGAFFQVLEGPPTAVRELFTQIASDPRHGRIVELLERQVPERCFPRWSMGFAEIDPWDLECIPGLQDFFSRGKCFGELGTQRARDLVMAFHDGRWRRRVAA